jgi:hypothetical protein
MLFFVQQYTESKIQKSAAIVSAYFKEHACDIFELLNSCKRYRCFRSISFTIYNMVIHYMQYTN